MKRNRYLLIVSSIALTLGAVAMADVAYGGSNGLVKGVPHTVRLSNPTNQPLTNINITLAGQDSADFSQTNTCGGTLGKHQSCVIKVTFLPRSPGAKSAKIAVVTSRGEQDITLTGTGI